VKRNDEEYQIQKAFFQRVALEKNRHPILNLLHASSNGARVGRTTAGKLKATGLIPGVWDVHWPIARFGYHSLWMEFKSSTGKLSKEQKEFGKLLRLEGNAIFVVRDWQTAWYAVTKYGWEKQVGFLTFHCPELD